MDFCSSICSSNDLFNHSRPQFPPLLYGMLLFRFWNVPELMKLVSKVHTPHSSYLKGYRAYSRKKDLGEFCVWILVQIHVIFMSWFPLWMCFLILKGKDHSAFLTRLLCKSSEMNYLQREKFFQCLCQIHLVLTWREEGRTADVGSVLLRQRLPEHFRRMGLSYAE